MSLPSSSDESQEVVRRTGNFFPSLWGNRFASFSIERTVLESYDKQIEELKEKVKKMLITSTSDPLENVRLIDLLCRLGLSYHFATEIERQLAETFKDYTSLVIIAGFDLYTVSNLFRLFRQHGHPIPCDVFEKFRDSDGKFKKALIGDAKGILSLYEASHLAINGEQILDDALAFTNPHLESLATQSSSHVAKFITTCLYRPLHRCIPRLAAREFISFYEEDESKNEILLKFAKIDFNRLQLLYQEELVELTRWYRNLDISSNLVYVRDRIVETYFCCGYALCFEPQFSQARLLVSKVGKIITITDDTYDSYGTIEELRLFTDAIQRMDLVDVVDELPDYMQFFYRICLNVFDECEFELAKQGVYNTSIRDSFKELVRAYHVEAEWCNKGYVPSVDEYMSIARTTTGYNVVANCCYLGMGEFSGTPTSEWAKSLPKIQVASQDIWRLLNDIVSHEVEQKRGHVASFIECYMKQYGVSEEEAIKACNKRIEDAWKTLNEELTKQTSLSMQTLMRIANLARIIEVSNRYGDGYTNPQESLKFHIDDLLLKPIPI